MVANELIFDFAKPVEAFARQVVDFVDDAGTYAYALRGCVLDRSQRRLRVVEHLAVPTALDLAEQAMCDRIPLRDIRRKVGNAYARPELDVDVDEVLLEAQRARSIGAAAIEEHLQFGAIRDIARGSTAPRPERWRCIRSGSPRARCRV